MLRTCRANCSARARTAGLHERTWHASLVTALRVLYHPHVGALPPAINRQMATVGRGHSAAKPLIAVTLPQEFGVAPEIHVEELRSDLRAARSQIDRRSPTLL